MTTRPPASHLIVLRRCSRSTSSAVTGISTSGLLAASEGSSRGAGLISGSFTDPMIKEHETGALDYRWRMPGKSRPRWLGLHFALREAHPGGLRVGQTHYQQPHGTHRRD